MVKSFAGAMQTKWEATIYPCGTPAVVYCVKVFHAPIPLFLNKSVNHLFSHGTANCLSSFKHIRTLKMHAAANCVLHQ